MNMKICPECSADVYEKDIRCPHCHFLLPVWAGDSPSPQGIASSSGSASDAPSVKIPQCGMSAPEVSKPSQGKAEGEPLDLSRAVQLPESDSESRRLLLDALAEMNRHIEVLTSQKIYDGSWTLTAARFARKRIVNLIAGSDSDAPGAAGASGGS